MATTTRDQLHLLGLEGLSRDDILAWLDVAEGCVDIAKGHAPLRDTLNGKIVANLFFEDSTRTRGSFTIAAKKLGADCIDLSGSGTSVSKGESIVDTTLTVEAMGVDAIVIRAKPSGAPHLVAKAVGIPVINAGDGRHEHPTQGLLDLLTMRRHLGELEGKTIAIVGDIANSRVARSNVHGLVTLGAQVHLIGPPDLAPASFEKIASGPGRITVSHDLDAVLADLDAIMMLRVQFERQGDNRISDDYRRLYGLSARRATRLRSHAIIMHPGPMNRGLEIDGEVADDPQRSVIREQVTNGVAVRMAVLHRLIAP